MALTEIKGVKSQRVHNLCHTCWFKVCTPADLVLNITSIYRCQSLKLPNHFDQHRAGLLQARQLFKAGIRSPNDIAARTPDEIAEILKQGLAPINLFCRQLLLTESGGRTDCAAVPVDHAESEPVFQH